MSANIPEAIIWTYTNQADICQSQKVQHVVHNRS